MKKDIYKITNKINGKIYIGQSINTSKRMKQHTYNNKTKSVSKITNAIKKYGIENFTIEIIEHNIENYNEREKYWINYYKSDKRKFGYNIMSGGECLPIICGENSSFSLHSDLLVNNIQDELVHTDNSFRDIAKKYNVRLEYVYALNQGICRINKNYTYPLRPQKCDRKPIETILSVQEMLDNTTLSINEIAKIHNISRLTISRFNKGIAKLCPKNLDYPIRESFENMSKNFKNNLIKELMNNKKKFSDIQEEYGISHSTLSRFNNGKIYKSENIKYPIRKSSERVY